MEELKNIWIVSTGSRGDVQPYTAVGEALHRRGYNVRFYTNEEYVPLINSFEGVTGVPIRKSNESVMGGRDKMKDHLVMRASMSGDSLKLLKGMERINVESASMTANVIKREIVNGHLPDLVLVGPLNSGIAWFLALEYGVPFINAQCQVLPFDRNYMYCGLPTLPFGLHFYLIRLIAKSLYNGQKAFDRAINGRIMERYSMSQFLNRWQNPDPKKRVPDIIFFSPTLAKTLYPACDTSICRFVGSTVIPRSEELNERHGDWFGHKEREKIDAFINKSSTPPVYMGWGSMISNSTEFMTEFCVRALRHANQRAIVCGGRAGLSLEYLDLDNVEPELIQFAQDNILFVEAAPHEWLLPKVSMTIHHGGAGTTTACLRAGVPTIITPVFLDQFDHAHLVNELGVGIGFHKKQLQKISYVELGETLLKVAADTSMRDKAKRLGEILSKEDGASCAADEVETFWKEYCVTGAFNENFPGQPVTETSDARNLLICAVVVAAGIIVSLIFRMDAELA
jgi:sterol 3beta-glucosyltransferase